MNPTPEQIQALLAQADDGQPIVMINLLRYRERAAYPPDADFDFEPCSGREAYQRYSQVALRTVAESGGRPIWLGEVATSVIAPEGEQWDDAVLVEYPSRKAFFDMIARPDYRAGAIHRTAALEDSRLFCTVTRLNAFSGA